MIRRVVQGLPLILVVLAASPARAIHFQPLNPATGTNDERLGVSVAAGDWNGDGFTDIAVGEPLGSPNGAASGRVRITLGRLDAFSATPTITINGIAAGDSLGWSLCFLDFNNDGFDDLAAGAPGADNGANQSVGKVFVYFGSTSPDTTRDGTVTGSQPGEMRGWSVANAGIFDDGFNEVLVVGAPRFDSGGADRGAVSFYTSSFVFADFSLFGSAAGDQYGYAVAGGSDVNGDGLPDVVVGAPFNDVAGADAGRSHLVLGTTTGSGSNDLLLDGADAGDLFGSSVALLDMNRDGFADIAVGAPEANAGTGAAYVFAGAADPNTVADLTVNGVGAGDDFGASVANGLDLNADSFEDLLVGAPNANLNAAGTVTLYFGGTSFSATADALFTYSDDGQSFGTAVCGLTDYDGDGFNDLAITDPDENGAGIPGPDGGLHVYLAYPYRVLSPNGGERWMAGRTATVEWRGHDLADVQISTDGGLVYLNLVVGVGGEDVNSIEVLVPAIPTREARIRVVQRGQTALPGNSDIGDATFEIRELPAAHPHADRGLVAMAGATGSRFGRSVALGGDFNGDGIGDLVVGSPAANSGVGQAAVFFGGASRDTVADVLMAGQAGVGAGAFGFSVAFAGDVNGDGFDDIVVGAPQCTVTVSQQGRAYLFLGGATPNGVADVTYTDNTPAAGDQFGFAVAGLGDGNSDGFDDVLIGIPFDDAAGTDAGRVVVFAGGLVPSSSVAASGTYPGAQEAGASLATGHDWDDDGYTDYAIGAPGTDVGTAVDCGRVFIVRGLFSFQLGQSVTVTRGTSNERVGSSIAFGDVDGNGRADLLALGRRTGDGVVYGYLSDDTSQLETPDFILNEPFSAEALPFSVATADLNGDQRDDVVVGGVEASRRGRVMYWLGEDVPASALMDVAFEGAAVGDSLGWSIAAGDFNGDGFDEVAAGAPFGANSGAGRVVVQSFSRFHVLSPDGGETWNVGSSQAVRWLGAEPADVQLSSDGGATWETLAGGVGGDEENALTVRVPHLPTRFARVRVVPADPAVNGADRSDSLFTIQSSVALLGFAAQPSPEGVELSWHTEPGVGPDGLAGYRVYRLAAGAAGQGQRIGPELIAEERYLDTGAGSGSRWRLTAVNGLGEELELGFTGLAAEGRLALSPNPLANGSALRVSFVVPRVGGVPATDLEVGVFDVRGRRVAKLARGPRPPGEPVVWDPRTSGGVSPGIYFVRASAPSAGWRDEAKVVVLR